MKQALEKLQETRQAALGVVVQDPKNRAGHEMKRRHAERDLPALKAAFDREFAKVAFPVLVKGSKASEFAKLVSEETGCVFVTDPLDNIKRMVSLSIGRNGTFSVTNYAILSRELRQAAEAAGIPSQNIVPDFQSEAYVPSPALVSGIVNEYVTKMGPGFMKVLVEKDASAKAETLDGGQPVVPVLIAVDWMSQAFSETVVPLLFNCNGKYVEVDTDTNVLSNELVISTLRNIKKTLKQEKK
jgi:hypothetical protein